MFMALGGRHAYLAAGELDLVVISAIDQFESRLLTRILRFAHTLLAPGGTILVGNLHPRNPTRAFMEHVLDWHAHHREEEEFAAVADAARCGVVRFAASPDGVGWVAAICSANRDTDQ